MTRERKSRTREEILAETTTARCTNGIEYVWATCGNCGGSGKFPSSMTPPGQCRFYCWERRTPETFGKLIVTDVDRYVRRLQARDRREWNREHGIESAADRKAREKIEAREAAYQETVRERAAAYEPDVEFESELFRRAANRATNRDGDETFLASLRGQLEEKGFLTEPQIEAAKKTFARDDERETARAEFDAFVTGSEAIPRGRVSGVEFQVLAKRTEDGYFRGQTTHKIMARSRGGWRVWMTRPNITGEDGYWIDLERGDIVRMNVTVSPKDDEFGFGSRPAKAEVVSLIEREV